MYPPRQVSAPHRLMHRSMAISFRALYKILCVIERRLLRDVAAGGAPERGGTGPGAGGHDGGPGPRHGLPLAGAPSAVRGARRQVRTRPPPAAASSCCSSLRTCLVAHQHVGPSSSVSAPPLLCKARGVEDGQLLAASVCKLPLESAELQRSPYDFEFQKASMLPTPRAAKSHNSTVGTSQAQTLSVGSIAPRHLLDGATLRPRKYQL